MGADIFSDRPVNRGIPAHCVHEFTSNSFERCLAENFKDYPMRRLALRAMEQQLSEARINSPDYQPRPTATHEFAMKWQKDVLTQLKPSTRSARYFTHKKTLDSGTRSNFAERNHRPTYTRSDCEEERLHFSKINRQPYCGVTYDVEPRAGLGIRTA